MKPTSESIQETSQQLEKTVTDALQFAKTQGADRSKISASCSMEKRLVVENKEFSLANTLESQKIGILVHKDQKKGSSSVNRPDMNAVHECIRGALDLAKFSVADEYLVMPSEKETQGVKSLPFLWHDATANASLSELQEFSQSLLLKLTRDKRVALDRLEVSTTAQWHGLYNSLGVKQKERQTSVSWSFMGMAVDGDDVSGFDYDGQSVYNIQEAHKVALNQCDEFVEKILKNLRPTKMPSYKGMILLTPRAVEEILLSTILYHASGSSVMDGKSIWSDKVGSSVISELITLKDDPHTEEFSGATSFDGDGLATSPKAIIEQGRLMMHLHDCYTAKRCKSQSTAMSGGPFGLKLSGGSGDVASMMNARSKLLMVDRFSGNIDPIKGDFSGVAKSSRYLENGVDRGAVGETMIAGNLFECLRQVVTVSRETKTVSGSLSLPWIVIDQVSVS